MNENEIIIEKPKKQKSSRPDRVVFNSSKEVDDIRYDLPASSCSHHSCGCEDSAARTPDEDTIRQTAYFIWEANKDKSSDACWIEAKKILGIE